MHHLLKFAAMIVQEVENEVTSLKQASEANATALLQQTEEAVKHSPSVLKVVTIPCIHYLTDRMPKISAGSAALPVCKTS